MPFSGGGVGGGRWCDTQFVASPLQCGCASVVWQGLCRIDRALLLWWMLRHLLQTNKRRAGGCSAQLGGCSAERARSPTCACPQITALAQAAAERSQLSLGHRFQDPLYFCTAMHAYVAGP